MTNRGSLRNEVQLIAYADRLGGSLRELGELVNRCMPGAFGGVHVLPFFTPYDGADAGFDPIDHTRVDERLGSWDDVRLLAKTHDVVVDVIVNHVSTDSPQFRDVIEHGPASPWLPMFLTLSSVFPSGASERDLTRVYRPRPGLPFTPMTLAGERRLVWTTFTPQQVDIDVSSQQARAYLLSILDTLSDAGVRMVRVDAVGYAVKTAGTSCFMTEQTFAFIDWLTQEARNRALVVLVEVHSYYRRQIEIGSRVDWVYDFALPPLVLHAAFTGDHRPLLEWMHVRPPNAITVLDTHDGIGIVDVGPDQTEPGQPGLLTSTQLDALVEAIHVSTGGESRLATGWAASNLDIYQVNATFYSALGRCDPRYLAARAVQFFTPGIPQVYYVGALAGSDDMDELARTGVGRDINRHRYTQSEIDQEMARPVVRALLALATFRNAHPAFNGACRIDHAHEEFAMTFEWTSSDDRVRLDVNLATGAASIAWMGEAGMGRTDDLLNAPPRLR